MENRSRTNAAARHTTTNTNDLHTRNVAIVRNAELARSGILLEEISLSPAEPDEGWDLFDDKYELLEVIAHDQSGSVYKARHTLLDRFVAIKIIRPQAPMRSVDIQKARLEGLSSCWVEHENAVSTLDGGVTSTGYAYVVTELMSGHSLQEEIMRHGRLRIARALWIARSICNVLAAAHETGVVHREMSLENIFLHTTNAGAEIVKIMNFGIAQLVDTIKPQHWSTMRSRNRTSRYAAPEQVLKGVDSQHSDIYGVGCILYEMLTGRPLFPLNRGLSWAVFPTPTLPLSNLREIVPGLPEDVVILIHAMLAEDPNERPSARATFSMLEHALDSLYLRR